MKKFSNRIDILMIVIGGIIAIYVQAEEKQNTFLLIAGILILMLGLMRLSRRIPSKHQDDDGENTIE